MPPIQFKSHLNHIFLLFVLIFTAHCSKENTDNPLGPDDPSDHYLWIHFAGDSTQIFFDDLETFDVNTLAKMSGSEDEAIWLSAFVDTQLVPLFVDKQGISFDSRDLYAYRIIGDDGFSASVRGYPDNIWEHMSLGYLLPESRLTVFPDDFIDLARAYNVKETRHIQINRKIDVATPDTSGFVRLVDMPTVNINNDVNEMEIAVSLKDVVQQIVPNPEEYTYNLTALDGYSPPGPISWAQFQTCYWLLSSMKTWFTDPALDSGKYKVKKLQILQVIP